MFRQKSPSTAPGTLPEAQGGGVTSSPSEAPWRGVRDTATSTPGRIVTVTVGLKLVVGALGGAAPGWLGVLDFAGSIVLVAGLGYLLVRILVLLQRRLLWRVRRKLVLSYILIGFVPIVLIVLFFLMVGVLMLGTASSSRVQTSFENVVSDAAGLAAMTAVDLRGLADPAAVRAVLERRLQGFEARYPFASIAVVPRTEGDPFRAVAGSWRHMAAAPPEFPPWIAQEGSGIVMTGSPGRRTVVARSAQVIDVPGHVVVIADLPIADGVVARMQESSGIELVDAGASTSIGGSAAGDAVRAVEDERVSLGPGGHAAGASGGIEWLSDVDLLDWSTGEQGRGSVIFSFHFSTFFDQVVRGGDFSFASVFWIALMGLGGMFLTIEAVALVMGFALAKSITGAVHELFTGTERVRRGDFSHRIRVDTRDQLGDLAGSFNAMTGSIADLLDQAKEKRRLEEELRIARDIQMSLLPSGPVTLSGLAVTALCRPAREVGGDYYDFMPLGEHRLGVLVADVSGKGTSAAFYMAELKGLILSLSQIYQSPKRLLMEVNRILSATLDNRTFITMMYAVVDLETRTLTFVRAGHTPLIYVPADGSALGRSQVLIPDGIVVGLNLDGSEEKFAELLEEHTLQIGAGDLFALYTDGITEAMNEESDLFGEERLSRLLEEHAHLPSDELRERILGDVEAFVGGAQQHDDMTIVLLRIDALPPCGVDV